MVCTPHAIRRILFRSPSASTDWTTALPSMFETVNYGGTDEDWITVWVSPIGGWRTTNTYLDGDPELRNSYRGASLTISRKRRKFEGKVEGCRYELYGMLKELEALSTDSNDTDAFSPVTILDYASPVDYAAMRTALLLGVDQPVERSGILRLDEVGSIIGPPGGPYDLPQGFTFTFEEINLV